MNRLLFALVVLPASLLLLFTAPDITTQGTQPSDSLALALSNGEQALYSRPVIFIENVGQFPEDVQFQAQGNNSTLWLVKNGLWLTVFEDGHSQTEAGGKVESPHLHPSIPQTRKGVNLKLTFIGANSAPQLEPINPLDTVVSYFVGSDIAQWYSDVPTWGGVRYKDLYPGVDLKITGDAGMWSWRLVQHGDVDSEIQLRVEGADQIARNGTHLSLSTGAGEFEVPLPLSDVAYQVEGVSKEAQRTTFQISRGLPLAGFPRFRSLTSKTTEDSASDLLYATYLGGNNLDWGYDIAVDENGAAYVIGVTGSVDFPTSPGTFDTTFEGGDAFVAKLNAAGSSLEYATFFGGTAREDCWPYPCGIVVDGSGAAYVTGVTWSPDFPTTSGSFDTTCGIDGNCDGSYADVYMAKLNATGTALTYATFLGGGREDYSSGIAIDDEGGAYITGETFPLDFPVTPGAFDTSYNGHSDAFVAKLNAAGSALDYATFLGGDYYDEGYNITVDKSGAAYIAGRTGSVDFPTTSAAFDTICGTGAYCDFEYDAFVTKINASGSDLVYSTFLGGNSHDRGYDIAVDSNGAAYVTGETESADFPTAQGAFDAACGIDGNCNYPDAFVTKINASGSDLVHSTFLGGNSYDRGYGIVVDGSGAAYVTGETESADFPTTAGSFDTSYNEWKDAFVVKVHGAGSTLDYATFLGGSVWDAGWAIAENGSGATYVTGRTGSFDFPTTPGAFDTSDNGDDDAFVVKLTVGDVGTTYSIAGQVTDGNNNPIPGVTISTTAGDSATTDDNGSYTVTDLITGIYTIIPSKSGYIFDPASRSVEVPPAATGVNFTATSALTSTLSISHIEVTQVIQDKNNSVPLITGRPTFVRVYVDCGEECTSLPNVTGKLRGYRSGVGLPGSPLSPINSSILALNESWTSQRGDLSKSLNFTLPPDWTANTLKLTIEVEGADESSELTFQQTQSPPVAVLEVNYTFNGITRSPSSSTVSDSHWWASRVYPANINRILFPPISFGRCLGNDCQDDDTRRRSEGFLLIDLFTHLKFYNLFSEQKADFVFGWLPEGLYSGVYGASHPTLPLAYGEEFQDYSPQIFAHEIGHLLGRSHTMPNGCESPLPPYDWPYSDEKIQEWGLDGLNNAWLSSSNDALKNPDMTYDYMSYCLLLGPLWTSPYTYTALVNSLSQVLSKKQGVEATSTEQEYVYTSGLVFADDTVIFKPFWVFNTPNTTGTSSIGIEYCLEVEDSDNLLLVQRCFDLPFVDPGSGDAINMDVFAQILPYPNEAARIVLKKGSTELAVQTISPNTPNVTLDSPNGGEIWEATGTYTATWTADDLDGDDLFFTVLYSPDGSKWIPLGTTVSETQFEINTDELPGSENAKLRIMASDGVNTSLDESDTDFEVLGKEPKATIFSPQSGLIVSPGITALLQGEAYDLEDGTLSGAALRWSSSLDGVLGNGGQILTSLSQGRHLITLTATDSDGNTVTATIKVFVDYKNYLPSILK